MSRRTWAPIIERARQLVSGYAYRITLRQLHYLLVAEGAGGYRNTQKDYDQLSKLTAIARRERRFPEFIDQTRSITQLSAWDGPKDAMHWLAEVYHVDRTAGQTWQIVLGGEKATLLAQLDDWFGDMGVPIVLLRGYSSQTYVDTVHEHVESDGRPAVFIYAGDFDPSGEDILRDFVARCPVFDEVEHVAVRPAQISSLGLIEMPGKPKDSRAKGFEDRHGRLVQVEAEAITPADLRALYDAAIASYWDVPTFEAAVAQEEQDRALLLVRAKRMR